ncbi:hypothetical protein CBM2633_B10497 [Cupriavidus taiwanensis]|nr:hypothetical protein CBM2633_B10497 [Cupriavidus taiwanensis]
MDGAACRRLCRTADDRPVQGRAVQPDLSAALARTQLCAAAQAARRTAKGRLHGVKGRVARGTASSAEAHAMGERFARVADLAWAQAQRVG